MILVGQIGGAQWEQALCHHLTSHVEDEAALLDAHRQAAGEAHSAAFSYLVSLIADDERRHHALFADMANTLRTEVDRRADPFAGGHILALTERFLAQERADAAQLEVLEAELEPMKDTTMWHLLVRLMEADTAKHLAILEFIETHVVIGWNTNDAEQASIEEGSS